MSEIFNNTAENRYEIVLDGAGVVAVAYYEMDSDGNRVLTHTLVPESYRGQGLASRLAHFVFDDAKKTGTKLVPECAFMVDYYAKHPEYKDVVAE